MHVIKYDRRHGQLEITGGYEIIEFKVNSSSITITTVDDREKRLNFSSSKCVQVGV